MNKRHPYRVMEREYITTDISVRELSRKHGISAHSLVVDQSQKHDWAAKREAYRQKESESFIEKHADRMADRHARLRDKVLDTIDLALDKFRSDLKATKVVRQSAWYMTPKDMAILLDRLQVLFERPSVISQHQGLAASTELSVDTLREFIEATAGIEAPSPMEASPLPRTRRLDD